MNYPTGTYTTTVELSTETPKSNGKLMILETTPVCSHCSKRGRNPSAHPAEVLAPLPQKPTDALFDKFFVMGLRNHEEYAG